MMPVNSYSTCDFCCGLGFFCLLCFVLKCCIPLKNKASVLGTKLLKLEIRLQVLL